MNTEVVMDGSLVRVGDWVFDPQEDTVSEAEKAITAWTVYRDWLREH